MKRKFISLKKYLEVNKKFFAFLTSIMLLTIIAGSVFSLTLNESDTILVSEFLSNYLESITSKNIANKSLLSSSLIEVITFSTAILLLGYSVVGSPLIMLLFFYKSFIIGFSISSILINYRVKGILLSILYIFPHQIISLLLLIILIINITEVSFKIIQIIFFKHDQKLDNLKIIKIFFIITLLLIILSLYGTLILPNIMKLFLTIK